MQNLESLYDSIVEDMNKEGFKVSDKYKAQYEELGKVYSPPARSLSLVLSLSLKHSVCSNPYDYWYRRQRKRALTYRLRLPFTRLLQTDSGGGMAQYLTLFFTSHVNPILSNSS